MEGAELQFRSEPSLRREEITLPDPRKTPLRKQADFFDNYPHLITPHHLNNLFKQVPGNPERGFQRMDRKLPNSETEGYSRKRLDMTRGNFYELVDKVVEDLGLTESVKAHHAEIERLAKKANELPPLSIDRAKVQRDIQGVRDRINESILGVYSKLREAGLRHMDLVV